jgi:hypothetical protein
LPGSGRVVRRRTRRSAQESAHFRIVPPGSAPLHSAANRTGLRSFVAAFVFCREEKKPTHFKRVWWRPRPVHAGGIGPRGRTDGRDVDPSTRRAATGRPRRA